MSFKYLRYSLKSVHKCRKILKSVSMVRICFFDLDWKMYIRIRGSKKMRIRPDPDPHHRVGQRLVRSLRPLKSYSFPIFVENISTFKYLTSPTDLWGDHAVGENRERVIFAGYPAHDINQIPENRLVRISIKSGYPALFVFWWTKIID